MKNLRKYINFFDIFKECPNYVFKNLSFSKKNYKIIQKFRNLHSKKLYEKF